MLSQLITRAATWYALQPTYAREPHPTCHSSVAAAEFQPESQLSLAAGLAEWGELFLGFVLLGLSPPDLQS